MKKLRFLCLHGYSNSTELFNYMAGPFMKKYEDFAEFYVPEGLNPSNEPVPKIIKEMNMKLPLRSWFDLRGWVFDETLLPPALFYGFANTIDFLLNYMNENGPFDGFLTFS